MINVLIHKIHTNQESQHEVQITIIIITNVPETKKGICCFQKDTIRKNCITDKDTYLNANKTKK